MRPGNIGISEVVKSGVFGYDFEDKVGAGKRQRQDEKIKENTQIKEAAKKSEYHQKNQRDKRFFIYLFFRKGDSEAAGQDRGQEQRKNNKERYFGKPDAGSDNAGNQAFSQKRNSKKDGSDEQKIDA